MYCLFIWDSIFGGEDCHIIYDFNFVLIDPANVVNFGWIHEVIFLNSLLRVRGLGVLFELASSGHMYNYVNVVPSYVKKLRRALEVLGQKVARWYLKNGRLI